MVKFVSKLATIDKTIRTRVSQQLGGIEYIYKTAENPTDLVQNIFVTLSVAHQARKELSDGRYVLRLDDGIEAGLVKRALARANKAMLETGAKFYITEYLEARIRAGVSVTVIEKELIKQLKILVGPSIGADFRLRLDPRVHAVFSGGAERGRAHGEISIEWDAAGDGSFVVGPSIGVEMTKGEKMAASVGIMMRGQTYVPTDPKA
ncbi:MAG TPA: hypothetical protein PK765_04090 [bacterium]|nr:hypothetical protein [bacterium]